MFHLRSRFIGLVRNVLDKLQSRMRISECFERGLPMHLPIAACVVFVLAAPIITSGRQITTSQYDNMRTGATLTEKVLTPQNVNAKQFGKLGAFKVDGAVYAQPLFEIGR